MSNWYGSIRRITLCLAVATVADGCGLTAPPPEPAALDVQNGHIGAPTAFSVRNIGSQVVFVSSCGGRVLLDIDRRVNNEWVNAAAGVCLAINSTVPIRVEAGSILRDNVTISATGTYRLRVAVLTEGPSALPESVVSPSFAIE